METLSSYLRLFNTLSTKILLNNVSQSISPIILLNFINCLSSMQLNVVWIYRLNFISVTQILLLIICP